MTSRIKLLVANRGEIAIRIFRACRDLGIGTVAVYSEVDRDSLHVSFADEAFPIGPAAPHESYLNAGRILDAARACGAALIHPGYGFLAENADFARACQDAGMIFVGPAADAIAAMGSKIESRRKMIEAGIPVVPGMSRAATLPDIRAFGAKNGYPILLKASAGGGGKGMRIVRRESEAAAAYERASAEALAFFSNAAVFAEKLVEGARHVEVQVVFDARGRGASVGERECSLQRRQQKIVEECPSPVVGDRLRARMSEAALAAARAVGYASCGTVEFLLGPDGEFFFLEMNTRLQVEHPVTEEVYGIDLVREMISIARGEALSIPDGLAPRGHAIECRIYAEDAEHNFAPSPGRIECLTLPHGPGVRHDLGVEAGSPVPIDYDPMLGKMIVLGRDRAAAVARLSRALWEYEIVGVKTTLPFFRWLCAQDDFRSARFDTNWLDRKLAEGLVFSAAPPGPEEIATAAAILAQAGERRLTPRGIPITSAWRREARRGSMRGTLR